MVLNGTEVCFKEGLNFLASENSLEVQWLELCALTTEGVGSIPGQGTKIPQAAWPGQKKKKKKKNFLVSNNLCGWEKSHGARVSEFPSNSTKNTFEGGKSTALGGERGRQRPCGKWRT